MIRFVENRDVLIKADFKSGKWAWVRGKTGEFDTPLNNGCFFGFGLTQSIQAELYSWFHYGKKWSFQGGTNDREGFERKGVELAELLALESLQRFNVYYESPTTRRAPSAPIGMRHIPWKHRSDVPIALTIPLKWGSMWEGKVSICFGHAQDGWVQLAILCTAFNNHHIISLSEAFDPFPGFVDWITKITRNESGILCVDEEGQNTYLTARTIDEDWFELIVEVDSYNPEFKKVFPSRRILAVVNRRAFVGEFYRRFMDFLEHEYSQNGWWYGFNPKWYSEAEIARTIALLPPSLDLGSIRSYLGLSE